MPRGKKKDEAQITKTDETKSEEITTSQEKPAENTAQDGNLIKEFPEYENARVIEIIGDIPGFYHCRMSDGTTKHVPKNLFLNTIDA